MVIEDPMADEMLFGESLRRHRSALDLTQTGLVRQVAGVLAFARLGDGFAAAGPAPSPASAPAAHSLRPSLPAQLTPLVGRAQETADLCTLLRSPQVRLVTLTGPGGSGKTRLALAVAAALLDDFPDGVSFVDLAPLSDPSLVLPTIAQTLGAPDTGGRPLQENLIATLAGQRVLLLLDNFEQVATAAPLASRLLAALPQLKILITSRAVLRLQGEHEWKVQPLDVPDLQHLPPLEQLAQYAAVRLFVQRAAAVQPGFTLASDNAATVAAICQQLEGLPLAIELAAARVKLFSPSALLARLDHSLVFLTSGHDRPDPQQTIRQTIDWSYHLLDSDSQVLFARLGVFVGGWTLEAAETVGNTGAPLALAVADGLAALVDHSLVQRRSTRLGEVRFHLLETIRAYAQERLEAAGEAAAIRQRHLETFLALAESAAPEMETATGAIWLERLEAEQENVRAALAWAQESGQASLLLRLAAALGMFWFLRGRQREGRRWLEHGLALLEDDALSSVRARAHHIAGALSSWLGEYAAARIHLGKSLAAFQMLGDQAGMARTLYELGDLAFFAGFYDQATSALVQSLELARQLGDPFLLMHAGGRLGIATAPAGDLLRAVPLLEESLLRARQHSDAQFTANLLQLRAFCWLREGDLVQAAALYRESLLLWRELGDHLFWVYSLIGLAEIALRQKQPARAATLLGAGEALQERYGAPRMPTLHPWHQAMLQAVHTVMTEEALAAARAAGWEMTLPQVIAYALAE